MLNDRIQFDYNHMLSDTIGEDTGISIQKLEQMTEPVREMHHQIRDKTGAGSEFLGFLDLPFQEPQQLSDIQMVADRLANISDIHIVLGIGGSYLGARTLFDALCHPYHNHLPRSKRKDRPRIHFEGNNMDTDAIQGLLDLLPSDPPEALHENWSLNVISKSGGTIETAVAFRLFRHLAEKQYGSRAADHIVATTDASKGKLKVLADQKGYATFVIPDNVGGRYSVLTPVGLLPAAVAGVDVFEVMKGAREMAQLCQQEDLAHNPAYLYAALQYLSYQAGRSVSVMNIWDKSLEHLGFWYDQLCAESLGKNEKGRVPLTAVSTRDLHARGQQLQDGARNTVITNIRIRQANHSLHLAVDPEDLDELNYVTDRSIHSMLQSAFEGTNYAYTRDRRPNMSFTLADRSAYTLGAMFYLLEVATVAEGYLMRINPLDQPGVEDYKRFMFGILGRDDMKQYRDEFKNRKPIDSAFVL